MKELNIASFSDVHLGHPNTPTELIIANLDRAFPDTEETGRLDAIILGGDLFDRSLHLHDPNVIRIKLWIYRFLRMCQKRDIELWVLEGTPSHDWRQSAYFTFCNEAGKVGAKVRYIDTLCIEESERLGTILFVPDEWAPETDDTWRQVQQLLADRGLEQVDYAVIHGSFTYQLPEHVKSPMHIPERYLSIVRKYILVGHVHKASQYVRILANGSFDRLTHGEEEAKGHWRLRVDTPTGDHITFVENTGAKTYKTVDCRGLSLEESLAKIDQCVPPLRKDSAVRIQAPKGDPILSNLDVLRKKYAHVTWATKVTDTAVTQTNLLVDLRSTYTQVAITRSNIRELLMERVRGLTSDPEVLSRCEQRLSEMTQ